MLRIIFLLFSFFVASSLFFSCQENVDGITEVQINFPEKLVNSSVSGLIYNEEFQPISGVQVIIGSNIIETDINGYFRLDNIQMNTYGTYIKTIKQGFFNGAKFIQADLNKNSYVEFMLIDREVVGSFSTTTGGAIEVEGVASLLFSDGGIIDTDGQPYEGIVMVFATWLDPTASDLELSMPGDLRAVNLDQEFVQLATFGMIGVELEGIKGQSLQLASGTTVSIELPISSSLLDNAPSNIPLWYFDKTTGYWIEEGEASLVNGKYVGEVSHFSFWNCDAPFPLVEMTGSIVTETGEGLTNLSIKIEISSSNMVGYGWTNDEGEFSGKIPKNENLLLIIKNSCGIEMYSEVIGPFGNNVELDPIVLEYSENMINLSGGIADCDGNPITEGYVKVAFGNNVMVINANDGGNFSGLLVTCNATELEVVGVDFSNQLQSESLSFDISISQDLDVGILSACDELDEFFFYSLAEGDTIHTFDQEAYTNIDSTQSGQALNIFGVKDSGQGSTGIVVISIDADSPGTYNPLYVGLFDTFNPNNTVICELCEDIEVTITEFGEIGELARGYFNGQALGNGGNPVQVDGAFKVIIEN